MKSSRRNRELVLLLVIMGVTRLGLFLVEEATAYAWPVTDSVVVGVVLVVLLGHAAIRYLAPEADAVIYPLAVALNVLGLLMIYRLDVADLVREQVGAVPAAESPSDRKSTRLNSSH